MDAQVVRKALLSLQEGRITPIYESDDFGSYLIIKPEEDSLIEYQVEMISNNNIPGLLAMDVRCKNNEIYLYYKITSLIPLSKFLSRKKIDKRQLLNLLNQITQTMLTGIDYLLYNKCYILEQDFIYMDPASFKLYMVYLPMALEEDVNQNLRKLIIDLIINATYIEEDEQGDGFIRKIINYIKGDTFNVIGFNKLLKQLNEDVHEIGDELEVSEGFLTGETNINGDIKGDSQVEEDFEIREDFEVKENFEINEDSRYPKKTRGTLKNQRIFAIGAAVQIILIMLFLLSRNFLETLGGDIKTTYAAAILIILAIDALIIKNLLDYGETLEKRSHKSRKDMRNEINARNETNIRRKRNTCDSENNERRHERNIHSNTLGYNNEINCSETINEVTNSGPGEWENDEDSHMISSNYLGNKDSPWLNKSEYSYGSKTVVLSPKRESKPYIVNMAGSIKEEVPIDKKEFLIGRMEDMVDFVIKNAAVGKVHALITEQNGKYYLKDLNSVNGTMVNDVRLQCNEEKELKDGDRITFANCDYLFVFR